MLETFLILLAGGIMLAVAISNPKEVTLNWLRLAGIIALTLIALTGLFMWRRPLEPVPRGGWITWTVSAMCVLAQLAFSQMTWRTIQRWSALGAFLFACASAMLQQSFFGMPVGHSRIPGVEVLLSWFGIAAMCGIALMDMLLGHAYLTASKMTMKPFERLNLALAGALVVRAISAVCLVLVLQYFWPQARLWGIYGLLIGTRWLVGLLVAGIFVYMAHDCIKRRATQSATGILYVAGVLIFLGEIIALHLVRETGLPF